MVRHRTPEEWRRRALRLEWATNGWNAMEVVVTISLGVQAGSLALIAFGLDSVVEIFASTVVIRNLRDDRHDPGRSASAPLAAPDRRGVLDPRRVLGRHECPRPDSRRSPRQFTARRRVPGHDGIRHVRPRPAQARDRRRAGQRAAAGRSRHDLPRRMSELGHSHRAGAQRLARLVVDRRRRRAPRRRVRDQRRDRALARVGPSRPRLSLRRRCTRPGTPRPLRSPTRRGRSGTDKTPASPSGRSRSPSRTYAMSPSASTNTSGQISAQMPLPTQAF